MKFLQANKEQTYHYYDAVDVLGQLAIRLGSFDAARKQFEELKQASSSAIRLRGLLGEAMAVGLSGPEKGSAAAAILEQAIALPVKEPDAIRLQMVARLRKAAYDAGTGKGTEAVAIIEKILDEGDEQDAGLFAEAYLDLGKAHEAAGRDKDAVLAFLHIDLLYSTEVTAHAEALLHLSRLWPKIGKPDQGADAKNRWQRLYAGDGGAK